MASQGPQVFGPKWDAGWRRAEGGDNGGAEASHDESWKSDRKIGSTSNETFSNEAARNACEGSDSYAVVQFGPH